MSGAFIDPVLVIAATAIIGLCIVSAAFLNAWLGWLELKRRELDARIIASNEREPDPAAARAPLTSASRIELADLKERIRKLEAIASGIEP